MNRTPECPHCPDGHDDPNNKPWAVYVAPERDLDGEPVRLHAMPTEGGHVSESDAEWLRQVIRDAKASRHAPLTDDPCGVIPTGLGRRAVTDYRAIRREQHPRPRTSGAPT
jgi:hypothetical protein